MPMRWLSPKRSKEAPPRTDELQPSQATPFSRVAPMRQIDVLERYERKLWMRDLMKDVAYPPVDR